MVIIGVQNRCGKAFLILFNEFPKSSLHSDAALMRIRVGIKKGDAH
jgi:hypothetical protein